MMLKKIVFIGFIAINVYQSISSYHLVFPKSFLKGVGFSSFQNGGSYWGINNWNLFEDKKTMLGRPTIALGQVSGKGAGFWQKAFEDIRLMKELGCNAVRFSVEWAEVEPEEGVFNEKALAFYEKYCSALIKEGIIPTITLHHFTHPLWFEQKGGWEREENIALFVRFAQKVFERLGTKVSIWYTINEPTVYSFMGYILGMHAPGKIFHIQTAGIVLKHLLQAHVATYAALKKMPGGDRAQIGLVHQVLKAQGYSPWHPVGDVVAGFLNFCSAQECVKNFLKTGDFNYYLPGMVNIKYQDTNACNSYDFIGINYYSRVVVRFGPTCYPHETMTDMEYPIFAQGLYDTIVEMSELGVPIYITENGIPDNDDTRRDQFIKEYLCSVYRALADGYDVRGYFYWTLMDNFEWDRGFTIKFGLYDVNRETLERTLRKGAYAFRDFFIIK